MYVKVLLEAGIDQALRGLSYSYHDREVPVEAWWEGQRAKAYKRAEILAHRQGGHNKFLESIMLWVDIEAPRGWWQEFDTYRVGVTKNSESTMHTLSKRPPEAGDFEPGTPMAAIIAFRHTWDAYKSDIFSLKMALPEGFLQRRVVCLNYKTLQNIVYQRQNHRLRLWKTFCSAMMEQIEHPEYIVEPEKEEPIAPTSQSSVSPTLWESILKGFKEFSAKAVSAVSVFGLVGTLMFLIFSKKGAN